MPDPVIAVENLSKEYRLGVINHGTLRQDLQSWWARMCGREDPNSLLTASSHADRDKRFLALDDVSFEVQRGEILGIIGRNGAGKSTLLKILSRITAPTSGTIRLKGRVASLLEVGTGFHPELTGRENVFLNGAILGMSREEIRRKFDEILAFAEVEQFIDTPVKRYSSGMYVRLAFAVAAHLEPEILVVDEVLAVGDSLFQKKCLGKMQEVGRQGRTVLFVSHNMGAVLQLCGRALLLSGGRITAAGSADVVVNDYLSTVTQERAMSYICREVPNERAWIAAATIMPQNDGSNGVLLMSGGLIVECELEIPARMARLTLSVQVKEMNNSPIYHFPNGDAGFALPEGPGKFRIRVSLPPLWLYPGTYSLQLTLCESMGQHFESLHIVDGLVFTCEQDFAVCPRALGRHAGLVFRRADWSCEKMEQR